MKYNQSQTEIKPAYLTRNVWSSILVFISVWISSAWFHQSRDWNVASRLMLVYALGDRGSVSIDGLQRQTGDLAFKDGHYYCDKAPGYSLFATPGYLLGKMIFQWPDHPLNQDGFAYWPADAWITLCTSGLASAVIATCIFITLQSKKVPPKTSAVAALFSVWASPMAVYATLAYGHQVASAMFLMAFLIVISNQWRRKPIYLLLIGLFCGLGVLTELAQAPLAIAIGISVLASDFQLEKVTRNALFMIIGATPTALILLGYNFIAFGSPLDMGYFYHATKQFAKVHSADNPLGLNFPDFGRLMPLIWGEYRGLLFYAPWTALAPVGWMLMIRRQQIALCFISVCGFMIPLWVNLSYPEWTGGWSTGPRLLVPAMPWLGLAAGYSLQIKLWKWLSIPLYIWGWIIALMFAGVGGRISQDIVRPFAEAVWPLWTNGRRPVIWTGEPFTRLKIESVWQVKAMPKQALIALLMLLQAFFAALTALTACKTETTEANTQATKIT